MAVQLVKKWGNSPAVRLPVSVMEAAHLTLDQAVDVGVEQGRVVIEPVKPAYAIQDLIAGITVENRHGEQDFGIAEGRELL